MVSNVRDVRQARLLNNIIAALNAFHRLTQQLPADHPLRIKLDALSATLRQFAYNPQRIRQSSARELRQLIDRIETLQPAIEEYLKKHEGELDPHIVKNLKDSLKELGTLKDAFKKELTQRGLPSEESAVISQNAPPASNRAVDSMARGLLLNEQNLSTPDLNNLSFHLERSISFGRIFTELTAEIGGRDISLETLIRSLPETTRIERTSPIAEMLGRLLLSFVLDKIIRDIVKSIGGPQKSGGISGREIEKAIEETVRKINNDLSLGQTEMKTDAGPQAGSEKIREQRRTLEAQNEKFSTTSQGSAGTTRRVVYDIEGKVVKIEIIGRLKETDLVRNAREAVKAKPAEALPVLLETAMRLAEKSPEAKTEILRFLAEVLPSTSQKPTTAPASTGSVTTQLLRLPTPKMMESGRTAVSQRSAEVLPQLLETAARLIEQHPESKPRILQFVSEVLSPTPTKISTATPAPATNPWISEPALEEVVRMITSRPEKTVQIEVAKTILQNSPQVALPVLVKAHAKASPEAKAVIEPLIHELAQTEEGQKYVIGAFATGTEKPLVSSATIGKEIIVQAAKGLLIQAQKVAVADPVSRSLIGKKGHEQLLVISKLVAEENKLVPERLTAANAASFLKFVSRIQHCLDLAGTTRKVAKAAARRSAAAQTQTARSTASRRKLVQKPAAKAKIKEIVKTLRELSNIPEADTLLIPKAVTESIYAVLAGARLVPPERGVAQGSFITPQESASASSMKRIVEVLEAQIARGITRKDQTVWSKVFTLSAQAYLYGIIMRLVRGRISEVDRVIEEIKKRGKLSAIIKGIKEGDIDTVTENLYDVVLEVSSPVPELALAA